MMSDTAQADYRMEIANATLLKSPEFISLTDSYPMYIRKFQLTRTVMTTDIRIYVTESALDNISCTYRPISTRWAADRIIISIFPRAARINFLLWNSALPTEVW